MKKTGVVLPLLLWALAFYPEAFALTEEGEHPRGMKFRSQGPKELEEIINTENQVHGRFFDGFGSRFDYFYYAGDAEAFNTCLQKYAALDGSILVIHDGAGVTNTFSGKKIPYDWMISVVSQRAIRSLQLYAGGTDEDGRPRIRLENVRVPLAITVQPGGGANAPEATKRFVARHMAKQDALKGSGPNQRVKRKPLARPFMVNCIRPGQPVPTTPEKQVIDMKVKEPSGDVGSALGFPTFQWFRPFDKPQERLRAEPKYKSAHPIYYAARYGDGDDDLFTLVIDESGGTGSGYDLLYVDCDNDNRIDAKKERLRFRPGDSEWTAESTVVRILVLAGGKTAPYHFRFSAFPFAEDEEAESKMHAFARGSSYYVGEAVVGGKRRTIAVADLNSNGLFDDPKAGLLREDRVFVDLDGDGKFTSRSPAESFPLTACTRLAGEWYSIAPGPDGGRVVITRPEPEMAMLVFEPPVVSVGLKSKEKGNDAWFHLSNGGGPASPGAYAIRGFLLNATDADGKTWELRTQFDADMREVTLAADKTARLAADTPLRVEIQTSESKTTGSIDLAMKITSPNGGQYQPRALQPGSAQARFEIRTENGDLVASGAFRPG